MTTPVCTSVRLVSKSDGYKLQRNKASDGNIWHMGCVRTPYGFVAVYADERMAILQFILDSHEYEARIQHGNYTTRGLVTLARRFAQEIAG
jgi:hypothetical protein